MPVLIQRELDLLDDMMKRQTRRVANAFTESLRSLEEYDFHLIKKIKSNDQSIDELEQCIEEQCLRILLLYQPVASDFRYIVMCLKVNKPLERIGDYAVNIAERSLYLSSLPGNIKMNLGEMGGRVLSMVKRSFDVFFKNDAEAAARIREDDERVDAMRNYFNQEIIEEIKKNPSKTEFFFELISLVRHFERIADMSKHIAEEIILFSKGKMGRLEPRAHAVPDSHGH